MIKIDYLDFVGQSSGTANHPHYQSILNYPHPNIEFQRVQLESEINDKYGQYLDDLVSVCKNLGYDPDILNHTIPQIHPNCKYYKQRGDCGFAPTLTYYGPEKHLFNVEDWFGIYGQLDMRFLGTTDKFDRNANSHIFILCHMLLDNFLGVTTHMKDSIKTFNYLFSDYKLDKKFIYFPLATNDIRDERKDFTELNFLFTNGYGSNIGNFHYRNGHHVIQSFIEFCNKYNDVKLTVLGTCQHIDHPNIRVIGHFLEDEQFNEYFNSCNVMLIPSRRVHTVTTMRSLSCGMIPVVSDGWGFDDFITDEYNGFVVKGQDGYTSFKNEENLEALLGGDRDSAPFFKDNLIATYEKIYHNRSSLSQISQNCLDYAKENFSIEKRNDILWNVLNT